MTNLNDPGTAKGGEATAADRSASSRVVLSLFRGLITVAPQGPSMREIAEEVAAEHGVSLADMLGPRRWRRLSGARQEGYARAIETGRFSYPQVGRFYRRDHTTVLYGVRAHYARLKGLKPVVHRHRGWTPDCAERGHV